MRRFGVTVLDNLQPRWNVAPSQKALVVTRAGLQPESAMVAWGLPPAGEGRSFLINARMETAAQKPTFREPSPRAAASSLPAGGMNGRRQSSHGMSSLVTAG